MDYIKRVTGMMTDKLMAVSQNHHSSDQTTTKLFFNYLNVTQSSNCPQFNEILKSCFTEFSKFS